MTNRSWLNWRRAIFVSCLLVIQQLGSAQQTAPFAYPAGKKINFVRTWDAVKPDTNYNNFNASIVTTAGIMTTQYIDGLGRPIETVVKQGSMVTGSSALDLVVPNVYDEFSRERFKYLSFAANNTGGNASLSDGLFKLNPFQQDSTFSKGQYPGEAWYYTQSNLETSPLSRVQESFAQGNSWVGTSGQALEANRRSVKAKYWFNTLTDSVRIWTVTDVASIFGTYATAASYSAGELTKMVTVDEHGNQVIEFSNKNGSVILKKVQLTATADNGTGKGYYQWLCTYYLYDALNRLRAVVQPRGVELLIANSWNMGALSNAILDEQCFRYEYDPVSRISMKKVPGAGAVYMVYDGRDRLVLTQDAKQRIAPLKWLYTIYDSHDRPIATGLWTTNTTFATHATNAASSTSYPDLAGQTYDELTRTFYDNYDWLATNGNPFPNTRNTANDNAFLTPSNTVYPYPQSLTQHNANKGMVTGSMVKVIGSAQMLYSINYYDEDGKIIQSRSNNITDSTDLITTQYAFNGKPLRQYDISAKNFSTSRKDYVFSSYEYDNLGRLLWIKKAVYGLVGGTTWESAPEVMIVQNEYDALGQLKRKRIAPDYNSNAGLDSLAYDYNIRGWMLGMNRRYAKDEHQANYFGFDLGYDKAQNGIINNYGYYNPQFNGNIEGMVWKSKGDGEKRKYDFYYDVANRLTLGDFNQYLTGNFNKLSGFDFSVSELLYDANGNIMSMKQVGRTLTGSVTIDSLKYNYVDYSNRLRNVIDKLNVPDTKLGDFRTAITHPNYASKGIATNDYTYDVNGNMIRDYNKAIGDASNDGILYNHLNLPWVITIRNAAGGVKGTITYTYDASGNKLKKVTYEAAAAYNNNVTTTTETKYIAGTVFESKTDNDPNTTDYTDVLQFITHEEGRIRYVPAVGGTPASFPFDYMVKDHLGNVRMLLTTEQKTDVYPYASLETAGLTNQRIYYAGVDTGRVNKSTVPGYPSDVTTSPNDFTQKLNGNGPKIGTSIVLKVMAGDQFIASVKSWYNSGATPAAAVSVLASLVNSLNGAIGGVSSSHGGATVADLQGGNILNPGATSYLATQAWTNVTKPKAFLNWVLFDEQFKLVEGDVSSSAPVTTNNFLETLSSNSVDVTKNGFLYIYVSNETPNVDVFFDNLQINHIRGRVLEETHYYPFGLTMAGISSKALNFNKVNNRIKYNDKEEQRFELSDGSGLDWLDYGARMYDNQAGVWHNPDVLAETSNEWSPYTYAYNNPIRFIDPDGMANADAVDRRKIFDNEEDRRVDNILVPKDNTVWANDYDVDTKNKTVTVIETNDPFDRLILDHKLQNGTYTKGELENQYKSEGYKMWHPSGVGMGAVDLVIGGLIGAKIGKTIFKTIANWSARRAIQKLGMKELQALNRADSKVMNEFFTSNGAKVPAKEVLLRYRELANRLVTGKRGAYQKMTEESIQTQSKRIEMIDEALKKLK